MKYTAKFNKELQIATLESRSDWEHISVHNLMQNAIQKQPSINAYLGARYSRSSDSITDIAKEIVENNVDASSRLESIFQGYGHKSVGDMADIFVCIENVPMITAMRAFNINPTISGQERSTRFQNFQTPDFVQIPKRIKISNKLREKYSQIILQHINNYTELLPLVQDRYAIHFEIGMEDKRQVGALQARAFDTVRYFLPLGLNTSLGFIMSARNWSEYISRLRGSGYIVEEALGNQLYDLLAGTNEVLKNLGYIPEADGLIRHADSNKSRVLSTKEVVTYLKSLNLKYSNRKFNNTDPIFNKAFDPEISLISHYLLQLYPNIDLVSFDFKQINLKTISQTIFKHHHHNDQVGGISQTGSYSFDGYTDHGVLKDLNRHRSLERYVAMWESTYSMEGELDRDIKDCFKIPEYLELDEFSDIKKDFITRLSNSYNDIKVWYMECREEVGEDFANEYTKYLLPHAHSTRYRYYGSFDDLQYTINLRVRPGGHIAYREEVYRWLKLLRKDSGLWFELFKKTPKVDAGSREQFLDRG